jgi:hypothetical protein
MHTRIRMCLVLGLAFAAGAVACGSQTPTNPSVTPPVVTTPVDPGPVVINTPPVVGRFTVQGTRKNEPAAFADVTEEVPVSVEVTDAESPISTLTFNWSSSIGTFIGSGASVIWKAPARVDGPTDVTLNLEVVERYTSQGKTIENKSTGSTGVSTHDSLMEVTNMARQFLLDFSDSRIQDVAAIMRNFQPGCYGTEDETGQVADNRTNFTIIDSNVGPSITSVNFGGVCSFRNKPGDACARVPVYWKSVARRDVYDQFGVLFARAGTQTEAGPAMDQVAAMYYRDQRRWRLCDSSFDPDHTSLRAAAIRGMVP